MMLVDTSAWIELFRGTPKGLHIQQLLEAETSNYTSLISIAEISQWAYKNQIDANSLLDPLEKQTVYLELNPELLKLAGQKYCELRRTRKTIGLIDTIIDTTACLHGLTLVTADKDFENLPNVKLV